MSYKSYSTFRQEGEGLNIKCSRISIEVPIIKVKRSHDRLIIIIRIIIPENILFYIEARLRFRNVISAIFICIQA